MDDYYDEYSKPDTFSVTDYLREVRTSYRLLFGDESGAYELFKEIVGESHHQIGFVDPCLDELCRGDSGAVNSATSYSITDNFPILGDRLAQLQSFVERQDPGTLSTLWHDRRDLYRWYTIWSVIYIGGLSILLSIVQIGLAAAQVKYSKSPNV